MDTFQSRMDTFWSKLDTFWSKLDTFVVFTYLFRSRLTEEAKLRVPVERIAMYERVWDESDYVIPPSENNAFFVMTNVVLTPNQTRTTCPEDPAELPEVKIFTYLF